MDPQVGRSERDLRPICARHDKTWVAHRIRDVVVVIVVARDGRCTPGPIEVTAGIDLVPRQSLVIDGLVAEPDSPIEQYGKSELDFPLKISWEWNERL